MTNVLTKLNNVPCHHYKQILCMNGFEFGITLKSNHTNLMFDSNDILNKN